MLARTLLIAALLNAHIAWAQQIEQICWTVVEPPHACDNTEGLSHTTHLPSWAPSPAYITRVTVTAQSDPFPLNARGFWSIGVDKDSRFTIASGYPAGQNGPFDRIAGIGFLELKYGYSQKHTENIWPPISVNPADTILVDLACGAPVGQYFMQQAIWQICWLKP